MNVVIAIVSDAWGDSKEPSRKVFWKSRVEFLFQYRFLQNICFADRKITMDLTDSALDYLADVGFDPVYGARPLKRTIQRELEMTIAQSILQGDVKDGDKVVVKGGVNGITITLYRPNEPIEDVQADAQGDLPALGGGSDQNFSGAFD